MAVTITGYAHLGIRVHDVERSVKFYEVLGFRKTLGPLGPERVVILEHPCGVEINLIVNAKIATESNVLMDVPEKHAGYTHVALLCPDLAVAKRELEAAGIAISGGPIEFMAGATGMFVRDPDRNVIELHQRG